MDKKFKFTVIGLGLIGGSLAKALKKHYNNSIIFGIDINPLFINSALADNIIDKGFIEPNEIIYQSDIIFICTPVKKTISFIKKIYKQLNHRTILTDVGSTKTELLNYINSLTMPINFIGGHPMAGTEKSGYFESFAHIFENAYYILTPSNYCNKDSIKKFSTIIEKIGAIPLIIDAKEHDRITGSISHVPHVVASALVNLVRLTDSKYNHMRTLAAGGFKDITRIASSNPEIWENIVLSNKEQIKGILNSYVEELNIFIKNLDFENTQEIRKFFSMAKDYRDTMPTVGNSLIPHVFEITVDVIDKPGIIGEIATLLGKENINIKNIMVTNSRENENGCLILTLSSKNDLKNALSILINNQYKAFKKN